MSEYAGNAQLRRLVAAMLTVGADLELPVVLERITTAARDLVDARYGALGVLDVLDVHRRSLSQFITVGMDPEERAKIGDLPKGHGILGLLIREPQPLRLPDLAAHPDSYGFPPNHPPMTSFLGVPLYVRGEVFGALYLTDKRDGGGFSDIDEELATSLAAAAALAIQNAWLHVRMQELSVADDRERIAHDLHDNVVQRLLGNGMALEATVRLIDRPEVAERIVHVVDDLDATIRDIRSTIFKLDRHRGPGPSLRLEVVELAAEAGRGLGFEPVVRLDGPIDVSVDDQLSAQVLAVLREALSNVARHAGASRVGVRVVAANDLLLEVVDDGVGLPSEPARGSGLRNISERAGALGGNVHVGAAPGGGTALRWSVPLPLAAR